MIENLPKITHVYEIHDNHIWPIEHMKLAMQFSVSMQGEIKNEKNDKYKVAMPWPLLMIRMVS